ncbi:MAG: efflux RND transporter periplasmic adaptor subunit [Alphaproteobacteria bacterium]|nr:efflux RND transporter periplasmic adaptor subunit [Alphaproteobacteria bacterium]
MRFFPILTAIVVTVAMYFVLFQRPQLVAFANGDKVAEPAQKKMAPIELAARPPVTVLVQKSTAQQVVSGLVLRGRTEAARNIDVRSQTSSLVISEPLQKGSFVREGQLLCQLDVGNRQVALLESQARLAEAKINETAATSLAEKGFGSETVAAARRAGLETAQAGLERAKREITRLSIRAPFDGLLESDTAQLGALLQPGSLCGNVLQLDPIKLVGFVPEQDIGRIKFGAQAGGRLVDGSKVAGTVSFLSRSADPQTRTFRIEVTVPNPDMAIRDGSTAEIFISYSGARAHLLPQSALTLDDGGNLGVRAVVDGRAKFMPVEIVRDSTKGVWLSGLPEQVDVIVVGQEYAIDGRQVSVTYKKAAK